MSSRVLKQQLSALTRQKGEDKELAPQKKQLKSQRRSSKAKAKSASLLPRKDKPDTSVQLSEEVRKKNLERNLAYLAATKASNHAQHAQEKMQQVSTSLHYGQHGPGQIELLHDIAGGRSLHKHIVSKSQHFV